MDNRIKEVKDVIFDDDPAFFSGASQDAALELAVLQKKQNKATRSWRVLVILETFTDEEIKIEIKGV